MSKKAIGEVHDIYYADSIRKLLEQIDETEKISNDMSNGAENVMVKIEEIN